MKRYFYKRNRFHQLKGFCAVMKEGSIAKAADIMHLSATSIGLQIQALERELGIVLFKRMKQRLHPTEDAWVVYREALQSLDGIDNIYDNTAKLLKNKLIKPVRIAAHFYALSHLLPPSLEKFATKYNIELDIHNTSRDDGIEMLKNRKVDILIFPLENFDNQLLIEDLYYATAVLGVGKKHPLAKIDEKDITWEEIAKYQLGYIGKNVTMQGLMYNINRYKIKNSFAIHNGTWDIGRGFVAHHLSIGFFEEGYLNEHDKQTIVVKNAKHLLPDYSFQIAMLAEVKQPVYVQELIALFKEDLLKLRIT